MPEKSETASWAVPMALGICLEVAVFPHVVFIGGFNRWEAVGFDRFSRATQMLLMENGSALAALISAASAPTISKIRAPSVHTSLPIKANSYERFSNANDYAWGGIGPPLK